DTGGFASGITVNVCGPSGCPPIASVSNGSGQYQLSGVTSGTNWNVVTDPGGCSASTYSEAHRYGVTVSDDTTTSGVDLHVTKQKGTLSGKVLNLSGQAVANVTILVD